MSSSRKRPQLTSEELLQLKWLLGGVLTLIGISTVFYMDIEAWTLSGVTALATLATMLRPRLPARVPSLVHTLVFPAIVLFFVLDLWLMTEVLPAMVRLDILLLLYRNISYRQRRDDLQIIVLGLFLIIVAGVLTVSLTFAAQILVYTACALALLMLVTLSDAVLTPAQRAPVPFGETPAWAQHMDVGQLLGRVRSVLDWRVAGLGVVLFLGVVVLSGLLFLAIPRFQLESGMFLERLISKKSRSGFSDTVRFGDVTEILQDNGVALSVDVSDESRIPAAPYWRMLALDVYENGTFRFSQESQALELERERSRLRINSPVRLPEAEPVSWTFYLESGVSRYLPLLGRFETLQFREPQTFRHAPRLSILALREEPVTMLAYRVDGFEPGAALPDPTFARDWLTHETAPRRRVSIYLQLPAFSVDTDFSTLSRALAAATGGEKLPAAEFARRVNAWLKRNHAYTLSPRIPAGGDPLVRWLDSQEPGHCELFAGSFVLLARAAGHPARLVTGFRGGSWNGYSNNFTIRNADAHAWAEIFDAATGAWLRADPLAAAAEAATEVQGAAAVAARLDRSWVARLDSLRVFWYRRIVSFDQQTQVETLKAVKEATQNSGKIVREALEKVLAGLKSWVVAPWDFRRATTLIGLVMAAAALVWAARMFGRDWWRAVRRGRGRGGEDPVRQEAGRWLLKLRGSRVVDQETADILLQLQRLRFGSRDTWPDPTRVFRHARRAWRESRRRPRATRP